jgi:hypothetical protein
MQIDSQLDLLSSIVGEPMARVSLPYDWLIMPPSALVSWISAGQKFPISADEIVAHPNFHWPRHGLHFWHEFIRDGEARVAESFADTQAKFAYLFDRFSSLSRMQRRIWIYSNTQNNLDVVQSVAPALDFRLDANIMRAVATSLNSLFDEGTDEFLFLCRADRVDSNANEAGLPIRILKIDDSEVVGDPIQWAAAFRELIRPLGEVIASPRTLPELMMSAAPLPSAAASDKLAFNGATDAARPPAVSRRPPPSPRGGPFGFLRGRRI